MFTRDEARRFVPPGDGDPQHTSSWPGSCSTGSNRSSMTGWPAPSGSIPPSCAGCRARWTGSPRSARARDGAAVELIARGQERGGGGACAALAPDPAAEARSSRIRQPGHGWTAGSSTSCRCPTISPTWLSPAPPSPPRWPGHGGDAGLAEGIRTEDLPAGRVRGHHLAEPPRLARRPRLPVCRASPGPMSVEFKQPPRGGGTRRDLLPRGGGRGTATRWSGSVPLSRCWASIRRAIWPSRCCVGPGGQTPDPPARRG